MSHNVRVSLVLAVILALAALIAACAGGAAPTATAPAPTAGAVSNPPTSVPNTSIPATTAPVAATAAPTLPPPTEAAPTTATESAAPTNAPTGTSASGTTAQSASSDNWVDPTPNEFTKEDIDHIFPPGRGQDLVFQNCTNCHSWVPLVFARMDKEGWQQNRINHENRVTALNQEDRDFLYNYLLTNFPPEKEPPDNIPQELLDQWTSY